MHPHGSGARYETSRHAWGAQRIVVKIGSSVLRCDGDVDRVVFASIVRDIAKLRALNLEVIVVCMGQKFRFTA